MTKPQASATLDKHAEYLAQFHSITVAHAKSSIELLISIHGWEKGIQIAYSTTTQA